MSAPPERRRINGAEQVRDASGLWRTIRTWNPADANGRGGHRFSRYAQRVGVPSVRYIVEVPVTAHFKRDDGRVQSYAHQQDGTRWTVPVDEHAIGHVSMPADLAVVRDVGHHNRQKAFIREAIVRYLRTQPRDEKGSIVLLEFEQSDCWFTLDEEALNDLDGFTFSSEVEYLVRDRPPFVETILNRPLRHFANLPLEFLWKLDLVPQATQDLAGRCVQTQLVYCVRRRSQPGGDQQSAERVWARDEDLEPLLDAIEDALYPGRYEGAPPPAEPEPNPERERHRENLRAFLPAWRRDRVPGQRQSWIFQPGVPRDYEDLRRSYVTNTVLTRLPQFRHLGSFAEALRANSPRDMPLRELLWYFFELFPCHFRCYRRSGKVLLNGLQNVAHSNSLQNVMNSNAVLTQVKPEPYSRAGWREVGITSHMVIEVGKRLGMPVYIIHNDSKLYQWLPETKDPHRSAIVFNVWNDHAFLYAPGSRAIGSAAKLKVHARAEAPRVRLATRKDDSERARLEQMRPFDAEEFLRYTEWIRKKKKRAKGAEPSPMQHWSGVWRTTRIEGACEELAALGLSLHRVLGAKPSALVELTHKESRGVARVKQVHAQFETLAALAARLADWGKLKDFHYYGESPQALLDRFCCAALAERRQRLDRAAVFARQGDACDKCGLRDYLEVHHRKPVSQGGTSDPENLVGLCRYCHREETDTAAQSGMRHYRAYYSQFSPRIANLFMRDVRMPRAWVHGDGAEDPFGENDEEELLCLDIRGCRRNAIFTTERLPVFGPADEEREFNPLVPNLHADFFWVEEGDESEMLYQGPNLYHREAVQYMLDLGIVRLEGIRFALAASRHVPGQHFREVFQTLQAAVAQLGADPSLPKDAFNAMFGLWNRPFKVSLAARRSGCVDDLRRVDVIRSRLGSDEGVADCIVRTKVIGVESAYPLGLVALQKELVNVHRMRRGLLGAGVDIRGVRTDGIFFRRRGADLSRVLGHRYPNGEPMYSLKELPRNDEGEQRLHLVPRCPQKALAPQTRPLPPKPEMRVLEERDVPTAFYESFGMHPFPEHIVKNILEFAGVPTDWAAQNAHLVVENQGALVTGMPGTGKSLLISRIVERWRAARPDDRVVVMAPTHVAARLLEDGETIQRVFYRMKHNRVRDTLFVVDEVGMTTLSAIGRIAEWQLLGAKFVLLGDFHGQLLPIQDPWERMHMESADVYRQLARSLHLRLSENRRAARDPEHWWFLQTLYQFVWEPERLPEDVWAATQRYPWDGQLTADTRVLAVSHYLRTRVNRIMNERFVRPLLGAVLVRARFEFKDTLNQPQDMWVLPGMVLQGCSQSNSVILNGVLYGVTAVGEGQQGALFVQVRMLPRYRKRGEGNELITLCELDASRMLRLTHCTTYRSAQGSTIASGPVLLLDASHKYLDHRMLIVGLSRVASGAQLRVATRAQQEEAFGWAGQGREEFAPHRELQCRLDDRASTDSEATESESESESESEAQERVEEWRSDESDDE